MKLWIAGEIEHDVGDAFRDTRKVVEAAFNDAYSAVDYGGGITKWAYIAMITPAGTGFPNEVKRFDRKDRCLEFRLRIDHTAFLAGTARAREQLLVAALRRSINLAEGMQLPALDVARLRQDLDALATQRGWS